MICYQNKSQPSSNEINHRKMKQSSKNNFLEKQSVIIKKKQKQSTGCFCFSFGKKNDMLSNRNEQSRIEIDESMKNEALRMSREIAAKSFKNITKMKSNPRIQRQSDKKMIKSPSFNNIYTTKIHTQQGLKPFPSPRYQKQIKKQQFNMNRLTFSATNKSYQKTVNTTTNTSINQSASIDNGNLLGSLLSLQKDKSQSANENLNVDNLGTTKLANNLQKYRPVSTIRQVSVKKINLLKSASQFESIDQEIDETQQQRKQSKVITIMKAKQSSSSSNKSINSSKRPRLTIHKVDTSQQILSKPSSSEDINHIRYDYSSVMIDYFNPSPEMMKKIQQNNFEKEEKVEQNILGSLQQVEREKELAEPSMLHNSSFLASQSNVRSFNNSSSSLSSSQSNLMSFSVNNNNFNDFSCSFESIGKKEHKIMEKHENIFDGLGLSCINENEQSEVYKNESEISEYHPKHSQYFNQSKGQN